MLIGIFDSLGAQTDRLRCEVCQNLILSPMNTGLLRHAVLQQLLPFTVLKHTIFHAIDFNIFHGCNSPYRLRYWNRVPTISRTREDLFVATALAVYGIETFIYPPIALFNNSLVATALTVYSMRRRVRDSRGATRRWGPHISSIWAKRG